MQALLLRSVRILIVAGDTPTMARTFGHSQTCAKKHSHPSLPRVPATRESDQWTEKFVVRTAVERVELRAVSNHALHRADAAPRIEQHWRTLPRNTKQVVYVAESNANWRGGSLDRRPYSASSLE